MLRALQLQKIRPQTLFVSPSSYHISPKFSGIRFLQAVDRPQSFGKMAQAPNENLEVGDSINSLGEGYASRCEEEGFGGTMSGKDKQHASKDEEENTNTIAKSKDEHAKSPGSSEAKEEEKDRNQNKGAA